MTALGVRPAKLIDYELLPYLVLSVSVNICGLMFDRLQRYIAILASRPRRFSPCALCGVEMIRRSNIWARA